MPESINSFILLLSLIKKKSQLKLQGWLLSLIFRMRIYMIRLDLHHHIAYLWGFSSIHSMRGNFFKYIFILHHISYGQGIFTALAYPSLFATRTVPKDSLLHCFVSVNSKEVPVVL